MTPQLLQDYQSEIERLKFKLKKKKAKMENLRLNFLAQKDRADSIAKSNLKYEKELKKMQREFSSNLEKELSRRKKTEAVAKSLQRRISELEFLLEDIDEPSEDE
jgi:hypothetical protein